MSYKKTRLDNGIRIITHSMPDMESVALGIWIKVGGRYESFRLKGISHFLEHLCFKGSKNYSCRQIKESIEGVGGSLNGFTSEEATCYLAKLPARYLGLALDILSDMAVNPLLLPEEIDKERTVIIEEIKMYKDQPQSYVYELLDELLWPRQPLGMTISGTVESVRRIGQEELKEFKERHYTPLNIVVSAAGRLEHHKFIAQVKDRFRGLKDGNINEFSAVKERQGRPQLKLFSKDTEQAHLALGFHGFKRDHSLRYALGLLHVVLGANMSSRLFNEVREKRGLAYEIGTQVKYFRDTGAFIVHAGIDNRRVPDAIGLILKELGKTRKNPVGAQEFKRAKEFYLGQLLLALEDTLDHMLWIGESTVALDKTYSYAQIMEEINSIEIEDIRRVAQTVFKEEKLSLALIWPLKDGEKTIYRQLRLD